MRWPDKCPHCGESDSFSVVVRCTILYHGLFGKRSSLEAVHIQPKDDPKTAQCDECGRRFKTGVLSR